MYRAEELDGLYFDVFFDCSKLIPAGKVARAEGVVFSFEIPIIPIHEFMMLDFAVSLTRLVIS